MPRHLDPYSLRLFIAAAEEGSISRAAEREHIAPSAVSRRISDLEDALSVPLFVRSAKGISLTSAGVIAYERARQLELGIESLLRDVHGSSGIPSGRVRLLADASSVVGLLPGRLRAFGVAHPSVSIELRERPDIDIVRGCLGDFADVGVCSVEEVPAELEAWHFARDPLVVIFPRGHTLGQNVTLRFHQVAEHPLVCIQYGGALDRLVREKAKTAGLEPRECARVNSFDGVCRLVDAGLGLAIVPQSAAIAYAGSDRFEQRRLDEPWGDSELQLIALRKSPRSPAVEALINALKAGEPLPRRSRPSGKVLSIAVRDDAFAERALARVGVRA